MYYYEVELVTSSMGYEFDSYRYEYFSSTKLLESEEEIEKEAIRNGCGARDNSEFIVTVRQISKEFYDEIMSELL